MMPTNARATPTPDNAPLESSCHANTPNVFAHVLRASAFGERDRYTTVGRAVLVTSFRHLRLPDMSRNVIAIDACAYHVCRATEEKGDRNITIYSQQVSGEGLCKQNHVPDGRRSCFFVADCPRRAERNVYSLSVNTSDIRHPRPVSVSRAD